MKNQIVNVPCIKTPIKLCPGFAKKGLADYKLDIVALCGFGCRYCSSNAGNYLRINRKKFADLTEAQLGQRLYPADAPQLSFHWPDVLERLEEQLASKQKSWGRGKTLVFSMLTDGFSPLMVKNGITEGALRMVLERTSFRIRVLTKSAVVGNRKWIEVFSQFPGRFVVGFSTGTIDDEWAQQIEVGTSTPSARLRALRNLQDAGVPTFGMLCPVFPDMLVDNRLDQLIDLVRPQQVEHFWAEPYNDRCNWQIVRDGYAPGSFGYEWMTEAFDADDYDLYSAYAVNLYLWLRERAEQEGWLDKLRYLLYEDKITPEHAARVPDLQGLWLQSKPDERGMSRHATFAALQRESMTFEAA